MHMTMRDRSSAGSSARRQVGPRGRQDTRNQGRSKKPKKRLYNAGKRCCNKSHSKQTRWQRGKRPLFQLKSNGKKKTLPSVSHKSSTLLISFFAMRSKRSAVETSNTNHVTVTKAVHRCFRENKSERKRKKSITKLVIVYIALPSEKKKGK